MANRPLRSGAPAEGRRVVTGRKRSFTGYVPSAKAGNDYRLVAYESLLERDYVMHLESDREIVSYRDRDRSYEWADADDKIHLWHPDFTLATDTDRRICVEVKPWAVIEKKGLLPIFRMIARTMIRHHGFDEFRLVTDREIRGPFQLYNLEILHSARLDREIESFGMGVRKALFETSPASVGYLRRRLASRDHGFWSVCRVIADDVAALDEDFAPIEDRAIVDWSDGR